MEKKKAKPTAKIIFTIILAVILVALCIGTFLMLKPKTPIEENMSFFVYDQLGRKLDKESSVYFFAGDTYTFKTNGSYIIEIMPNTAIETNNFAFFVNGEKKDFFDESDLSMYFNIEMEEDTFSFACNDGNYLHQTILRQKYFGAIVEGDNFSTASYLFSLKITDWEETESYIINFNVCSKATVYVAPKEIIV